jgi:hypothetical protein
VNVDVDVPLFLPLSGQRRLYDLRRTAKSEIDGNFKVTGQMNFESGWEYGYYISNVVTARAVWDPKMHLASDKDAFEAILSPILKNVFNDAKYGSLMTQAILDLSESQAEIFVNGKVAGAAPADLSKLSGHAYMSGICLSLYPSLFLFLFLFSLSFPFLPSFL